RQPDPSAKAPCTRTTLRAAAAGDGEVGGLASTGSAAAMARVAVSRDWSAMRMYVLLWCVGQADSDAMGRPADLRRGVAAHGEVVIAGQCGVALAVQARLEMIGMALPRRVGSGRLDEGKQVGVHDLRVGRAHPV